MKSPSSVPANRVGFLAHLLVVFILGFLFPARVAAQAHSEEKVKAAFLLKFADYVTWPCGAGTTGSSPIHLGIIGDDPFSKVLSDFIPGYGPTEAGLKISRLGESDPALTTFHVLYFPDPMSKGIANVLDKITVLPILTVGEGESFLRGGGIIAFVRENDRIRFLINLRNAKRSRLKISSRLLSLAKWVLR